MSIALLATIALFCSTSKQSFSDPSIDKTVMKDVFAGDPFPKPWIDPGFKKIVFIYSPNFNHRPENAIVDTIVLHSTVIPTLEVTAHAFYRKESEVSSHFIIGKDGSVIESVNPYYRAWHAGRSRDFLKRDNLNNFSIGIELVNLNNGKDPYPEPQIEALRSLILSLKYQYPLKYITSHKYIAIPIGRKIDPAGFPWKTMDGLGLEVIHNGHAPTEPGDPKPTTHHQ